MTYIGDKARVIENEEVRQALARLYAVMYAAHDCPKKMSVWVEDLQAVELALRYILQVRANEAPSPPDDDWLTKRRIEDGMVVGKIDGAKL